MEKQTFALRLTAEADDMLRSSHRYHGDMSAQVTAMLRSMNLETIEVQTFRSGQAPRNGPREERPVAKTSIRIPMDLYEIIKDVAKRRSTSVNSLIKPDKAVTMDGIRILSMPAGSGRSCPLLLLPGIAPRPPDPHTAR